MDDTIIEKIGKKFEDVLNSFKTNNEPPKNGVIRDIRRNGDFVEVKISDIDKNTQREIEEGLYEGLSVEVGNSKNEEIKSPLLFGVALLGKTMQAEPTAKMSKGSDWHKVLRLGAKYKTDTTVIEMTDELISKIVTNTKDAMERLQRFPTLFKGHTQGNQLADLIQANDIYENFTLNELGETVDEEKIQEMQTAIAALQEKVAELDVKLNEILNPEEIDESELAEENKKLSEKIAAMELAHKTEKYDTTEVNDEFEKFWGVNNA